METITSIKEMRFYAERVKSLGKHISLVPTMGAFHEGHTSLMSYAKKSSDLAIVSIFVNPLQFGPSEDFKRYPRQVKRDRTIAEDMGIDALFCPSVEETYPEGFQTYVEVEKLTRPLCGCTRPGHFRGVTTVVTKLFNIIRPDNAVFGLKDYQQWLTIKRMVYDLHLDIEVIGRPTVREPDGLAMSSRNKYLSEKERKEARTIYQALSLAQEMVSQGEHDAEAVKSELRQLLLSHQIHIEYISLCHPETLDEMSAVNQKTLLALAVRIGKTRLIDNCFLSPREGVNAEDNVKV